MNLHCLKIAAPMAESDNQPHSLFNPKIPESVVPTTTAPLHVMALFSARAGNENNTNAKAVMIVRGMDTSVLRSKPKGQDQDG